MFHSMTMFISSSGRILLLLLAGGLGAVCRYALSASCGRVFGAEFPWGILLVNLFGCFLFGLLFVVLGKWFVHDASMKLVLLTGFLGAFTTFSTFCFDTVHLLEQSRYFYAFTNLALHNLLGMSMIYVGFVLGRWVI